MKGVLGLVFLCLGTVGMCAKDHSKTTLAYYHEGNAYMASEEYKMAAEAFQNAVDTDPKSTKAYYKAAAAFARLREKRNALMWLEKGYIAGLTPLPISWDNDFKAYWKDRDFYIANDSKVNPRSLFGWARKYLPLKKCPCCGQMKPYPSFIKRYDEREEKKRKRLEALAVKNTKKAAKGGRAKQPNQTAKKKSSQ